MKFLFFFISMICWQKTNCSEEYKYYTYDNSLEIDDTIHLWEGSELGDKFGYGYGYPTIYEYSWNNSKSVDDVEIFTSTGIYDLFITVIDGRIYTEYNELRVDDDIWIPAKTDFQIWSITKKGKIRIVRLGIPPEYPKGGPVSVVNTKKTPRIRSHDEHAACLYNNNCAVDIISENKTQYDPYIISVFFTEDSEISLHKHPCGAIYYILRGTMCFIQSSEETVCLGKGESYWTSPENKYKEYSKKNTEIKVLGFQCSPIFYR